jgi:sulfoxide reductase heme-binding subunit YedZ
VTWLAVMALRGDLGARPVTEAIHFTGDWTVRLMWITLAVTPAVCIFKMPKLLYARRTLGVATSTYILIHFSLYIVDQKFNLGVIASEIAMRFYLTIGFIALSGLVLLAITSTDNMVRRLGPRWNQLHKFVYAIAIIAIIHYLLQSKNDVWQPLLMAGFLVWLLGFRLIRRFKRNVPLIDLAGLGVVSSILTGAIEVLWYHFRSNVPYQRIINANFDFSYVIQPMWWVLAASLGVVVAAWLWQLRPQKPAVRKATRRPPAQASAQTAG